MLCCSLVLELFFAAYFFLCVWGGGGVAGVPYNSMDPFSSFFSRKNVVIQFRYRIAAFQFLMKTAANNRLKKVNHQYETRFNVCPFVEHGMLL
jgi:hypothetical protein